MTVQNDPQKEQRWILHVDMDAFFVSVEKMLNPHLEGKPVVVGGSPEGRGVVAAASYEARKYGIHSAMPVSQVVKRCPHVVFVRGHYEEYQRVSAQIHEIFEDFTPLVEMVSIDEAYLDLTGFDRLYGPIMATAERIRQRIYDETRCPASIGIATNKLVAKVASDYAKPNGICFIRPGHEAAFFAHLSIKKIPGIGAVMTEKLLSLGIKKVRDLQYLNKDLLRVTMGRTGEFLHERAFARGTEHINPPLAPKSIGNETTFDEDTVDPEHIESVLSYLTEKAAKRLRKKGMKAKRVTLKLRYSDFQTITRQYMFPLPTDVDQDITGVILDLFRKAFTRRTRIRLVGVTLSHLLSGPYQLVFPCLEERETEKWHALYQKVDEVREKYDFTTILNGHSFISYAARGRLH